MEMGMIGMLNVLPRQDNTASHRRQRRQAHSPSSPTTTATAAPATTRRSRCSSARSDSNFHELHELVQPLPFLELKGDFAQINGRGYPLTTVENQADMSRPTTRRRCRSSCIGGARQRRRTRAAARHQRQRSTPSRSPALGLPMKVVGRGAQIARPSVAAPTADSWAHETASITLGGGDGTDVLIDTRGPRPAPTTSTPRI